MSRDRILQAQNTQKASMPQDRGQKATISARLPYQKQQLSYLQRQLADMRASNEQFNNENGDQPNYFREAQQMRESNYINQISSLQQEINSGSVILGNLNSSSNGETSSSLSQGNASNSVPSSFNASGGGISSNFSQGNSSVGGGGSILDDARSVGKSVGNAVVDGLQKIGKGISDAANWFVSQMGGNSNSNEDFANDKNGNCGPTSLLMVARMFGAMGGGAADADNQIEQVRGMMGGGSDESKWTNCDQLVQGAQAMGLSASSSDKNNSDSVAKALEGGNKVIVNVNPKDYGGPDTGHFAVVTAINGDNVTLYDPAKQQPITISKSQLDAAMNSRGGYMVSVSK